MNEMRFTDSHEWIIHEGKDTVIGVTDFAQKELGDIVYVELPEVGKEVKQGEQLAVLESTKAAADVYAPLSGKILEVNRSLEENPEKVNQAAEGEGWLVKIIPHDLSEVDALLNKESYLQMVKTS